MISSHVICKFILTLYGECTSNIHKFYDRETVSPICDHAKALEFCALKRKCSAIDSSFPSFFSKVIKTPRYTSYNPIPSYPEGDLALAGLYFGTPNDALSVRPIRVL